MRFFLSDLSLKVFLFYEQIFDIAVFFIIFFFQQTTAEQDAVVKDWIDVRKIRQELEKARMLCEWIKKREIKKQELIAASGQLLDELLQPINFFLISVLDSLQALDERKIFSEPVTDKDVSFSIVGLI